MCAIIIFIKGSKMKKIDKLIAKNVQPHDMLEYENAINSFIGYNHKDDKKQEDVRLAKVIKFYIEFFRSIRDKERYDYINDVLDYYTKIVPNEEDLFRRSTIEFHIPERIKKNLYKGYIEFHENRKADLEQGAEELLGADDEEESEPVKLVLPQELQHKIFEEIKKIKEGKAENQTAAEEDEINKEEL